MFQDSHDSLGCIHAHPIAVFENTCCDFVPITQGIRNSRDTIAACEVTPPCSVTIAAAFHCGHDIRSVAIDTRISP